MSAKIKSRLPFVLGALAGSFAAACIYHYFQGSLFGKGYPYNTFLYPPHNRFSDYFDVVRASINPDPYAVQLTVYFPITYLLFKAYAYIFQPYAGLYILLISSTVVLLAWITSCLKSLSMTPLRRVASAFLISGCSYPLLFCWDRGNIEILLLAFVLLFLHFFLRGREWEALVFLIPAIGMKLYPAALLALYLPKRRYAPILVAGLTVATLSLICLLSFEHTVTQEIAEWQSNLAFFRENYLIANGAMASSASPWNIITLAYLNLSLAEASSLSIPMDERWAAGVIESMGTLLHGYSAFMLILALYLTWHVTFLEKDVKRQIILLLLFMVVAPAGGADYKMIYVIPALALMVTLSPRKFDFPTIILTTLVLIPKKYFFIPGLVTDSGYADSSYSILINPILMLFSLSLIILSGWLTWGNRHRVLT